MAQLILSRYELAKLQMALICMRCGAPAGSVIRKSFAGKPTGFLFTTKPASVQIPVPVCPRHAHMFRNRAILVACGLVAPMASFWLMFYAMPRERGQVIWWPEGSFLTILLPLLVLISMVFALLILLIRRYLAIRVEVEDHRVVLNNVAPVFVREMEHAYLDAELGDSEAITARPPAHSGFAEQEPERSKSVLFKIALPELEHLPQDEARELLERCLRSTKLERFRKRGNVITTIGCFAIVLAFIPLAGTAWMLLLIPALLLFAVAGVIFGIWREGRLLRRLIKEELDNENGFAA